MSSWPCWQNNSAERAGDHETAVAEACPVSLGVPDGDCVLRELGHDASMPTRRRMTVSATSLHWCRAGNTRPPGRRDRHLRAASPPPAAACGSRTRRLTRLPIDRLLTLGARLGRHRPGRRWVLDCPGRPEGNEFCVVRPKGNAHPMRLSTENSRPTLAAAYADDESGASR